MVKRYPEVPIGASTVELHVFGDASVSIRFRQVLPRVDSFYHLIETMGAGE